ncbi:hypothetical protein HG15A2_22120 [Adhaeretor mobilis]|uniref:Uncharacterized protein n=1 Tax=Adhaeretor mobilis TaxID=1930276 RepID=A0A517MVL3_9BACT|nr:hypothetical protein HG15A2_22120 [Adhaeretor mobilis]
MEWGFPPSGGNAWYDRCNPYRRPDISPLPSALAIKTAYVGSGRLGSKLLRRCGGVGLADFGPKLLVLPAAKNISFQQVSPAERLEIRSPVLDLVSFGFGLGFRTFGQNHSETERRKSVQQTSTQESLDKAQLLGRCNFQPSVSSGSNPHIFIKENLEKRFAATVCSISTNHLGEQLARSLQ